MLFQIHWKIFFLQFAGSKVKFYGHPASRKAMETVKSRVDLIMCIFPLVSLERAIAHINNRTRFNRCRDKMSKGIWLSSTEYVWCLNSHVISLTCRPYLLFLNGSNRCLRFLLSGLSSTVMLYSHRINLRF